MQTLKRTYALPSDTLSAFERAVRPGERSAVVGRLLSEWLALREREALRRQVEEGCREMWDLLLEEARAWEPLEAEVDRVLDA
ncbi:MAG: hypothetical protein IT208_01040 [Chthonomonadales bacterium]|nr:hypothetical protein [Chthonomonadales bacterium]